MNAATKAAREKHAAGVKRLNRYFRIGSVTVLRRYASLQHGAAVPVRLKAGCPPLRDAEHAAKHRKRKAAHAARRRNRS